MKVFIPAALTAIMFFVMIFLALSTNRDPVVIFAALGVLSLVTSAFTIRQAIRNKTECMKACTALLESEERFHSLGMDLEKGSSEVFAALEKISEGNRRVRIPETWNREPIPRLTSEHIKEMLDLSHEFTHTLAEHLDVLSRVSQGDFKARVTIRSNRGLLASLSELTNRMIDNMAGEVSERHHAEQAVCRCEQRFDEMAGLVPVIICETDEELKIVYLNSMGMETLGLSESRLRAGVRLHELIHAAERGRFLDVFASVFKGERLEGNEFRLDLEGGREMVGLFNASPFRREGEIAGSMVTVTDITIRKGLEAQLSRAQKMEAIGTLAGGIAHNFNNLLMGIQGHTTLMLLDSDPDDPHYERLKSIEKQVQSGSRLTRQLLGYAREGEFEIRPVSLNRLVREVSETFSLTRKEIRIHQDLQEDLHGIRADQSQMEQVLLNLYINAADAMPEGGDLFLVTRNITDHDLRGKRFKVKSGDYIRLTVRDTGCGIDESILDRVFEPFFTTKELGKGTGLGLASSYGMIKSHGGYIEVASRKGHGATFEIILPASKQEGSSTWTKKADIPKGKERILLVDDEEVIIQVGGGILKAMGYCVATAKNGEEALRLYRERGTEIDLVILDLVMPGMGGGEVYDLLKEIDPDIKVLLSSGYDLDGEAAHVLRRGCDGFIQKPFAMDQLYQKIREILESGSVSLREKTHLEFSPKILH